MSKLFTKVGTQCSMFGATCGPHEHGDGRSHATMCTGRSRMPCRPTSGILRLVELARVERARCWD